MLDSSCGEGRRARLVLRRRHRHVDTVQAADSSTSSSSPRSARSTGRPAERPRPEPIDNPLKRCRALDGLGIVGVGWTTAEDRGLRHGRLPVLAWSAMGEKIVDGRPSVHHQSPPAGDTLTADGAGSRRAVAPSSDPARRRLRLADELDIGKQPQPRLRKQLRAALHVRRDSRSCIEALGLGDVTVRCVRVDENLHTDTRRCPTPVADCRVAAHQTSRCSEYSTSLSPGGTRRSPC